MRRHPLEPFESFYHYLWYDLRLFFLCLCFLCPWTVSSHSAKLIFPVCCEGTTADHFWQQQFECCGLTCWTVSLVPFFAAVPGALPPLTCLTPSKEMMIRPRVLGHVGMPSAAVHPCIRAQLHQWSWHASSLHAPFDFLPPYSSAKKNTL